MEEAEEPEQKRIKRIAEHIEDEINRAQHLPLEELTRHKAAMVHMLQFLSIEEAYAVSLASRRIYEWFQQNDIWYALAQRWLAPARLAQCEAWVEQVKPKGKQINYLWLLLGEYMERGVELGNKRIYLRVTALPQYEFAIVLSRSKYWKTLPLMFADDAPPETELFQDRWSGLTGHVLQFLYLFLARNRTARVSFSVSMSSIGIRSKLPSN